MNGAGNAEQGEDIEGEKKEEGGGRVEGCERGKKVGRKVAKGLTHLTGVSLIIKRILHLVPMVASQRSHGLIKNPKTYSNAGDNHSPQQVKKCMRQGEARASI